MEKDLSYKSESAWFKLNRQKIEGFASDYMDFISCVKNERECALFSEKELKKNGFKDLAKIKGLKKGDKVYKINKNKTVLAAIIGDLSKLHLVAAHMDSPRLDLKPLPIVEDTNLALFKTHYYGGIKKYHWVNVPLALHGVIYTKNNKKINFALGEKDYEPKFVVPDLLPHLSQEQLEKNAKKVIEGEQLNVVIGNIPVKDNDIKSRVKQAVLKILKKDYKLEEEDFAFAELQLVPAGKAVEVGFDKSMIGAYGQDDKICSYAALRAFLATSPKTHTNILMLVDKEEVGSMGNTGAESTLLPRFVLELVVKAGGKHDVGSIFENSYAISADVSAAADPNFKDVFDLDNACYLGNGVCITKYTGEAGKARSNDASAEYMNKIRHLLKNIPWQTGELGKVDMGGGGTIAMYISRYGLDVVDAGPAVLAMHSPLEISSKADLYAAYLFYREFYTKTL